MAKIDIIRNTYGGLQYLQKALNYVTDDRAMSIEGIGVNPYNVDQAFNQMLATRRYFGKVSGNPLVHIIVAYNNEVRDLATAARYGHQCVGYFAPRFQILSCNHEKDFYCGSFHTHIVINAVSYVNGQMINTGYEEMADFCNYVAKVTGQRCNFYFDNKAVYPQV